MFFSYLTKFCHKKQDFTWNSLIITLYFSVGCVDVSAAIHASVGTWQPQATGSINCSWTCKLFFIFMALIIHVHKPMLNFEYSSNPSDFIKTICSTSFIFIKNSYWKTWFFFFLRLLLFLLTRTVILMGWIIFLKRSSKCFLAIKILSAFQHSIFMLMEKWHERILRKVLFI